MTIASAVLLWPGHCERGSGRSIGCGCSSQAARTCSPIMMRIDPTLKRLEVAWRNIWIRVLTRLMRRAPAPERPDWGARPYRVLFLRHDRIGDMILSTGLLEAIAQSHPTIKLDVLASPSNAPVLRADPH